MVSEDLLSCTNQFCPGKGQAFSATTGFDLLVDFTDHTGTLHSCSLRSPVAEKMLGCTVSAASLDACLVSEELNGFVALFYFFIFGNCQAWCVIVYNSNTVTESTYSSIWCVADRGVHQFDWWPADSNEVEISFGEMQNISAGIVGFHSVLCGLDLKKETQVQILLNDFTDTPNH